MSHQTKNDCKMKLLMHWHHRQRKCNKVHWTKKSGNLMLVLYTVVQVPLADFNTTNAVENALTWIVIEEVHQRGSGPTMYRLTSAMGLISRSYHPFILLLWLPIWKSWVSRPFLISGHVYQRWQNEKKSEQFHLLRDKESIWAASANIVTARLRGVLIWIVS